MESIILEITEEGSPQGVFTHRLSLRFMNLLSIVLLSLASTEYRQCVLEVPTQDG